MSTRDRQADYVRALESIFEKDPPRPRDPAMYEHEADTRYDFVGALFSQAVGEMSAAQLATEILHLPPADRAELELAIRLLERRGTPARLADRGLRRTDPDPDVRF